MGAVWASQVHDYLLVNCPDWAPQFHDQLRHFRGAMPEPSLGTMAKGVFFSNVVL